MRILALCSSVLVAAACGPGATGDAGTSATTATTAATEDESSTSSTSDGGSEPIDRPPYCHVPCENAGSCEPGGTCVDGAVCHNGCVGDDECNGYVCGEFDGDRWCAAPCQADSDCALTDATLDGDNWRCEAGACRYLGCNSDDECAPDTVCRAFPVETTPFDWGYHVPACVPACEQDDDCLGPKWDPGNYACVDGGCRWLGCTPDECGELCF